MYIALKKDYPAFTAPPAKGGLLTPWAERGVLMLNTCLTVRAHEANSHANRGWEKFTQRVIDLVAQKRTRGVVFMAWGTPAGKRVVKVDQSRHLVLKSVHPSPLSASRGFFDCGHFVKCNEWLVSRYGADGEIDWDLDPAKIAAEKKKSSAEDADVDEEAAIAAAEAETKDSVNGGGAGVEKDKTTPKAAGKTMPVPVIAMDEIDADGEGVDWSTVLDKEADEDTPRK